MQEQEIKQLIKQGLNEYFSPNGDNKRFFDATQIPRICNDIAGIRASMEKLATNKEVDDHEERIRKMEQKVWQWTGASAVIGALASFIIQKFI